MIKAIKDLRAKENELIEKEEELRREEENLKALRQNIREERDRIIVKLSQLVNEFGRSLYTVSEIAQMLRVSPSTVRKAKRESGE